MRPPAAVMTAALLLGACAVQPPRVVVARTTEGAVAGMATASGRTFLALRYAAPPRGERRWREPAPPEPFDGVRGAVRGDAGADPEDRLTLDLWLPRTAAPAAPLLVWIANTGPPPLRREQDLDGSELVARGVAVAFVHVRRGVLGTFAHPALERQRPGGPADFALLDAAAAVRWLHSQASAFGLDAARVAIGGSGTGADCVLALLAGGGVDGLCGRAIVDAPHWPRANARADALEHAQRLLADAALLPAATATDLRALPADRLLALDPADGTLGRPIVDRSALSAEPWEILRDRPPAVSLLAGSLVRGDTDAELLPAAAARWCATIGCTAAAAFLYEIALPQLAADGSDVDLGALLFRRDPSWQRDPAQSAARWLADIARDCSAAFVDCGVPASRSAPGWPAFARDSAVTYVLADPIAVVPHHRQERLDALTPAFARSSTRN